MQFRLIHTEVVSLLFNKLEPVEGDGNQGGVMDTFNLKINVFPDAKRPETFGVLFEVELTHHQEFKLKLNYLAWFECPEPIRKEDLESPFALINAPAIAFPYLRSFISLVSLNSGFRPAILPTVNFIKMYEESKGTKPSKKP